MQNTPNEFTHSEKPTRFSGSVDAIDGNKKPTIIKMQIDANGFDINRTVCTYETRKDNTDFFADVNKTAKHYGVFLKQSKKQSFFKRLRTAILESIAINF